MTHAEELKNSGLKATLPRIKVLEVFQNTTQRHMMRSRLLGAEQFEEARQILRDIDSLDSHSTFLFDKINFLMNATVGFININQNKIIKIFSVASVALLPPTLIASIYGMLDSPTQRQIAQEMATQTASRSAIVARIRVTTCGG